MKGTHKNNLQWLDGGGEMAQLVRSIDWSLTPLGPIDSWPPGLRTTISLCLSSNFPINILWGPDAIQIYNSGYRVICGEAHPRVMGESYRVTWASAWPVIGDPFERARRGESSFLENQRMFLERNGYLEETFFTFSLSPIRDDEGAVVGIFHPVTETTKAMLSERRTRTLREIGNKASGLESVTQVSEVIISAVAEDLRDLPFVTLYRYDTKANEVKLLATTEVRNSSLAACDNMELSETKWPFSKVLESSHSELVDDLELKVGNIPCGEYPENTTRAYVMPIKASGQSTPYGFVVVGLSTRLPFDETYQNFFELLENSISAAINNARAFEEEKKRAEALAEIDRVKSTFFSNVSHEFRTPLTLMLAPLEEALADSEVMLPELQRERLELAHRSALRLLKLVNSLLDFSRIEAGRAKTLFRPTDLSKLTTDLASMFRSVIEKGGLKFTIDTTPLGEMVFVDPEMWEKVILNLLSNAFKFTLEGEIEISLRNLQDRAELRVRDTGMGIPESELSHIFERFHRVEGARGRSYEGTGIGLALIQELIKLHGGSIRVESSLNKGSTFIVDIPFGNTHLARDLIGQEAEQPNLSKASASYLEEALLWLPPHQSEDSPVRESDASKEVRSRILISDDNADMRNYLKDLLSAHWNVETVSDGEAALKSVEENPPDLILSDVMMPKLNGFELLKELRSNLKTRFISVILLSARAGEEAKVEGLKAGADDYLVKPFSAKELLARVENHLKLSRVNQGLREALQTRDDFLSIASHELKTPLSSLKLQVQLAKRNRNKGDLSIYEPKNVNFRIDQTERQLDRLIQLVDDMLDISHIRTGKMTLRKENVDLCGLVKEVIERLDPNLKDAETPVTFMCKEAVEGQFDRYRLEQVVTNLLTNAIRYGDKKPVSVILNRIDENRIRLTVLDQGIGIDDVSQERIFDRFERAVSANSISGLGLGLYITRQIVETHGGRIWVESPGKGHGSTFVVELPT